MQTMVIMQTFDPSIPFLAGESSKGACDVYYCVPIGNLFLAWIDRGLHSPGTGLLSITEGWLMPIDVGTPMVVGIGAPFRWPRRLNGTSAKGSVQAER
ncbi:MAG: hypothetical protein NXI02_29675 [Rhodobacteraceae bacterium]|nr:hypothetical protein [Paracoccaceae bacterium]